MDLLWEGTFLKLVLEIVDALWMVRLRGVEPLRPLGHCRLKTARLPFRHNRESQIPLYEFDGVATRVNSLWIGGFGPRFNRITQGF